MTELLAEEPTIGTDGFRHGTFFYRDDDGFLAGIVPFVHDGLARGQAVMIAQPRGRLDMLRDALGSDADGVEFHDMAEVGANPARIIPVWQDAVERHVLGGSGLRGIGEPAFIGRRPAEFTECALHELLLNLAFDAGPAWDLLCPYDEAALPAEVCAAAVASHPVTLAETGLQHTEHVDPEAIRTAFAAPLPSAGKGVLRGRFGPGDTTAVRRTVVQFATSLGLTTDRVEDLALAAGELATNTIRHGGGSGTVTMWTEPGAAIIEFADAGRVDDPLVGRRRPTLEQEGGRGMYLVNQVCDLVQVRTGAEGTTVRVTTWLL
jgi:anti-sigma regulatory factor (Ser/Thr protein kinase)